LQQFPQTKFTIKNICIEDIFAFGGTNVVAAQWDIDLSNQQGEDFQNSGVTVITVKQGKAVHVRDYLDKTGKDFRMIWGEGV
jgi:ketosteroid isomerase-like protein